MQRRQFHRSLIAGVGLSVSACQRRLSLPVQTSTIKPPRLREGDLVGLISPGSYISDEGLERAVNNLEGMNLRVKLGRHIRAQRGYTAGTDAQRLQDLHRMFSEPEVKAVWCVRGGYGCSRLLPDIDYALIRNHPKILIGYSDITALLVAIYQNTGLVGFHGPVGASEWTDYNLLHLRGVLMEGATTWLIQPPPSYQVEAQAPFRARTITPGIVEGPLIGGNLSLLSALCGTPFAPDFRRHLVFMEEVGEKPYRIDRMLTQLRQATHLKQAAGLALGVFAGCEPDEDDLSLSLQETLDDRLGDLRGPVTYGLPFGHVREQCTLPVGIRARLDSEQGTLQLLEAAVM